MHNSFKNSSILDIMAFCDINSSSNDKMIEKCKIIQIYLEENECSILILLVLPDVVLQGCFKIGNMGLWPSLGPVQTDI